MQVDQRAAILEMGLLDPASRERNVGEDDRPGGGEYADLENAVLTVLAVTSSISSSPLM